MADKIKNKIYLRIDSDAELTLKSIKSCLIEAYPLSRFNLKKMNTPFHEKEV